MKSVQHHGVLYIFDSDPGPSGGTGILKTKI